MSTYPLRAAGTTSRELASGELAVLDAKGEQLILVSPVGAAVWALCDGTRDAVAIATVLHEHFGTVDREDILRDVERFLAELTRAGCLEPRAAP